MAPSSAAGTNGMSSDEVLIPRIMMGTWLPMVADWNRFAPPRVSVQRPSHPDFGVDGMAEAAAPWPAFQ